MEYFLAGVIAGILIERFHLIGPNPDTPMQFDHLIPEMFMTDFLFLGGTALFFGFFAWAVRALRS